MPLDWIMASHSTSWHLLISILHVSHCNSRLPHYLHISRVVLIDTVFCCLEQYQGCCCAALRSFLSICWQVLPVAMACWWNASSLLRAVKHPYVPQPFQMCFIISVSVMWLVCTIASLISHTHIHRVHGQDKASVLEKLSNLLPFCYLHACTRPEGWMGGGVAMWPCEVCWITRWEQAVLFANTSLWVAK